MDVVKHHVCFISLAMAKAKGPDALGPPDPLLVPRRPHLHLVQRHQRFSSQNMRSVI